jgi:hypothetical protein
MSIVPIKKTNVNGVESFFLETTTIRRLSGGKDKERMAPA